MPINSRNKGKVIERQFVHMLGAHGILARRTAQVRGKNLGAPDVELEGLDHLHIEVKGRENIVLGNKQFEVAWEQAKSEAAERLRIPLLAFRVNRGPWCLTYFSTRDGMRLTVCGDDDVCAVIRQLGGALPPSKPLMSVGRMEPIVVPDKDDDGN